MSATPVAVGLVDAQKNALPGRCPFCPKKLLKGRATCGRDECVRQYLRAWHRDMRRAHPERYGRKFYATRGGGPVATSPALPLAPAIETKPPEAPTKRKPRPIPVSPFTPTTCLIEGGISYAELCRRFDARYGAAPRLDSSSVEEVHEDEGRRTTG